MQRQQEVEVRQTVKHQGPVSLHVSEGTVGMLGASRETSTVDSSAASRTVDFVTLMRNSAIAPDLSHPCLCQLCHCSLVDSHPVPGDVGHPGQ